jgi:hypothetical protein
MRFIVVPLALAAVAAAVVVPVAATGASTPRCHTADLSARLGAVSPGAGQRNANLILTNTSGHTCQTGGYVGLQLTAASGKKLPTSTVRVAGTIKRITLKRGAKAVAPLQWGAIAGTGEPVNGPCEPTPSDLLVIPPNETTQTAAPWNQGPVCEHGQFSVSPLKRS